VLEHDEVPEAPAHHGLGGLFQCPRRRGEDELPGQVVPHPLLVGVLTCAQRREHVALGQDADAVALGVVHDRGTHPSGGHLHAGLAQGVVRTEGEDVAAHPVANLHANTSIRRLEVILLVRIGGDKHRGPPVEYFPR
jgi:hypothetical protein